MLENVFAVNLSNSVVKEKKKFTYNYKFQLIKSKKKFEKKKNFR